MFNFLLWQKYTLAFLTIFLLSLVGSYDYDNALASEKLYCEMTTSGSWPDYKETMIGCASLLGDDQ